MTDFVLVGISAEVVSINGLGTVVPVRVVEGEVKIGDRVFVYQPLPHSAGEDEKPRSVAKTSIVGFTPLGSPARTSAKKGEEVGIVLRALSRKKAQTFHFVGTQYVPRDGQPLRGPLFDRFDLIDKHKDNWRPSHAKKFGIGLQGGGLRGAFGVGAVRFLAELGLLDKANGQLEVLGSASTGSITSMVLMEKSGVTCVDKAIKEYTRLQTYEDMLTLTNEVENSMKESSSIRDIIPAILNEEVGMLDPAKIIEREILSGNAKFWGALSLFVGGSGGAIVGSIAFGPIGLLAGLLIVGAISLVAGLAFGAKTEAEEDAERIKKFFEIKSSIATLKPVEDALLALTRRTNFKRSGIALRMAVNNLETGQTGYITENGTLLYPIQDGPKDIFHPSEFREYTVEQIDDEVFRNFNPFMVKAAATSGSFPGIFPPRKIRFTHDTLDHDREEYFNDGGVRENLPIQAMIDAGAEEIVAIYCAPIEPAKLDLAEGNDASADKPIPSWSQVATRAVELTFAEITRTDVFLGRRLNAGEIHLDDEEGQFGADAVDIIDIAPRHPTLGLTEIETAKIQATIAYGYMCAFDETLIAKRKLERGPRTQLRDNTDEIFERLALIAEYRIRLIVTAVFRDEHPHFQRAGKHWDTLQEWLRLVNVGNLHKMAFQRHSLRVYSMAKKELLQALIARVDEFGLESLPTPISDDMLFLHRKFYTDWTTFQYDSAVVDGVTRNEVHDRTRMIRNTLNSVDFFRPVQLRTDNHQRHDPERAGMSSWEHRKDLRNLLSSATFLINT